MSDLGFSQTEKENNKEETEHTSNEDFSDEYEEYEEIEEIVVEERTLLSKILGVAILVFILMIIYYALGLNESY